MTQFIKSGDTRTPVANSRTEIERILRRYGAVGFNVQQEFHPTTNHATRVKVQFIVPDAPGSQVRVPVELPVSIEAVGRALYPGHFTKTRWRDGQYQTGLVEKEWQQAERVAWRNLVLWIDAALSAASVGLQTITEAFYAHAVVTLPDGGHARLSEVIEGSAGHLPPGVRGLLSGGGS